MDSKYGSGYIHAKTTHKNKEKCEEISSNGLVKVLFGGLEAFLKLRSTSWKPKNFILHF
jgi:hypothetical protein